MIESEHAPLAAHAGCTNIGILRRTPSASGFTSVDARITLEYGWLQGAFGSELASAQRNMRSGISSTPGHEDPGLPKH